MKLAKTLTAAALLTFSSFVFSADIDVNADMNDLAIKGYDPVAYFTKSEPTLGSQKFTAVYKNAIYQFSSKENRDAFKADPSKYAPQYGGYCAFGVTKEKKFDVDPTAWKVVDGKLYLNLNESIQKRWSKEIPGNIQSGNETWNEISHSSIDFLSDR